MKTTIDPSNTTDPSICIASPAADIDVDRSSPAAVVADWSSLSSCLVIAPHGKAVLPQRIHADLWRIGGLSGWMGVEADQRDVPSMGIVHEPRRRGSS